VAGVEGDLYISVVGECGIRHFDDEEYVLRERKSSGITIVTRSKKRYVGLSFGFAAKTNRILYPHACLRSNRYHEQAI